MEAPVQITFRTVAPSEAIESLVRERAAKLQRFHRHIIRCHVTIDQPHRHRSSGRALTVHIDVMTSNGPFVVTRDMADHEHEHFSVLLRDAFDAVARRLDESEARHATA
jgi:ribosome-associated translation inhibitor RaiA